MAKKINEVTDSIKKKLSFDDYEVSESAHNTVVVLTGKPQKTASN
jgi:hypothetical protein